MDNLKKFHNRRNLLSIYQSVILEVSTTPAFLHVQNPEMRSTLRMKLFISPKNSGEKTSLGQVRLDQAVLAQKYGEGVRLKALKQHFCDKLNKNLQVSGLPT